MCRIEFVGELPKTRSGKIRRVDLRRHENEPAKVAGVVGRCPFPARGGVEHAVAMHRRQPARESEPADAHDDGQRDDAAGDDAADAEQIREIASHPQRQDPGIIDRVDGSCGQRAQRVKPLGGAALAVIREGQPAEAGGPASWFPMAAAFSEEHPEMAKSPHCPLCNQIAPPDPKAATDMPLCARCQRAWDRAHAHDATVGSLVDIARALGSSFKIGGRNHAGPNTDSQADFDRSRKAIDEALDADNCVGQGRKAMLDALQKALEEDGLVCDSKCDPDDESERVPNFHIAISGCTAEVSVDPVYPGKR